MATENFFLDFTYTFSVFVFVFFSQLVNLDEKVRKKTLKIRKRDYDEVCPWIHYIFFIHLLISSFRQFF